MKDLLRGIYYDIRNNLSEMKVDKMTLTNRIKYEKSIAQLEIMKRIIDAL